MSADPDRDGEQAGDAEDEQEERVDLAGRGGGPLGHQGESGIHRLAGSCPRPPGPGPSPRRRLMLVVRMKPPSARTVAMRAEPHQVEDRGAVAAGLGVVLVAVEQDLVDGVADPPAGRVHEREPQVLRRVLDAEQVVGDPALGRRHEHAGGVCELLRVRVPHVAEARRPS